MGFRFRKTIGLGKLLRVNLSRSGASLSLGPRGARLTLSSKGVRSTLGLPGSGLSYTQFRRWGAQQPAPLEAAADQQQLAGPVERSDDAGNLARTVTAIVIGFLSLALFLGLTNSRSRAPQPSSPALQVEVPKAAAAPAVRPSTAASPTRVAAPAPATAAAPLSRDTIRAAQRDLVRLGFKPGAIDGVVGKGTRQAVRYYQTARALPQTGALTLELAQRLASESR